MLQGKMKHFIGEFRANVQSQLAVTGKIISVMPPFSGASEMMLCGYNTAHGPVQRVRKYNEDDSYCQRADEHLAVVSRGTKR